MLLLPILVFGLFCTYIFKIYVSLKRNIKIAIDAGLPYIVLPIYTGTPIWYISYGWILPPFRLLPSTWTSSWLDFLDPYWSWRLHHEPFARLGSDTIVVVSPWGVQFCTCDPDIILEVANRRNDFCKPVESYSYLDLFGPSIVTREGREWRAHRRVLGPAFNEQNTKIVWEESLIQSAAMVKSWLTRQEGESRCIPDLRSDTMSLPFNIINKAGFGVNIPWEMSPVSEFDPTKGLHADNIGKGCTMTYRQAMRATMTHLFHIVALPTWILQLIPFAYAKMLLAAHHESVDYLRELITEKANSLKGEDGNLRMASGFDILSALVATKAEHKQNAALTKNNRMVDEEALSDEAILANVLMMLIAGHETTATILLLTFVELAIDLEWQHQVQKELDHIFGKGQHNSWIFEEHVPLLSGGKMGATLNEVMRLYPPVNIIPKGTRTGSPQKVRNGPHEFTVPANTPMQFVSISAHQNPKYWPSSGLTYLEKANDLARFRPQRWLQWSTPLASQSWKGDSMVGGTARLLRERSAGSEASSGLFRPYPGSYIPFSIGHRACIGQRFAQIEMLAVVALVLKDYSVELSTEDFASDEAIRTGDMSARRVAYEQARDATRKATHKGMRHHLTMQQVGGKLAIRLIPRGNERFMNAYVQVEESA